MVAGASTWLKEPNTPRLQAEDLFNQSSLRRRSNLEFEIRLSYSGSPLSRYIAWIAGLGLPNPPNQRS